MIMRGNSIKKLLFFIMVAWYIFLGKYQINIAHPTMIFLCGLFSRHSEIKRDKDLVYAGKASKQLTAFVLSTTSMLPLLDLSSWERKWSLFIVPKFQNFKLRLLISLDRKLEPGTTYLFPVHRTLAGRDYSQSCTRWLPIVGSKPFACGWDTPSRASNKPNRV